ncbi:MAG: solute carrier family 26 protein, partial [Bacteroidetes bacterium]|nr:solute carrier family 26 protein [Bacteroidota bacterium]
PPPGLSPMLSRYIPALSWARNYNRSHLPGDLNAGITVGVLLIPQGLAYALIAGMPPIYGLYAAIVPLLIYALLGTSGQLAVGPVAMMSLLVATGVSEHAASGSPEYITLALLLAFMVGVIQLVLGLLRFGFITNFLSHPVLSGFTSAAALIIALSQIKNLTGIPIPRSSSVLDTLVMTATRAGDIHLLTLGMGLGGVALILILRRFSRRLPGGLLVIVLGTLLTLFLGLDASGLPIVGTVPAGLLVPRVDFLQWSAVSDLLPIALAIALVGYMESIAVAKSFAAKHGERIDPSQELTALGMANVVGSFFLSYPAAGGFGRTAVNAQAGARTPLASMISAVIVSLTLLFLTSLFTFLPNALLAAIILVAVAGLIDLKEVRFLWGANRTDLALLVSTFSATLFLGIEEGILIGVALSMLSFVYQASRPHMARLGRVPGEESYRNVERFPEVERTEGIAIFRIDASLFFGNVEHIKDGLSELLSQEPDTRFLILDLYPVNRVDSTAIHALADIHERLRARNVTLLLSGVKGPVRDAFARSGLAEQFGGDAAFLRIHDACQEAKRRLNAYLVGEAGPDA